MRLSSLSLTKNAPYLRWVQKGTLAIVDQGLFAGSNFVISVLLARWMPEDEYGAYSIAFSIFQLIAAFYNALLLEPMSIFGPVRHIKYFTVYLRQLTWLHIIATTSTAILLIIATGIANLISDSILIGAFFGITFGHGLSLFFYLSRRACYVKHQTGNAVAGTILYLVVLLIGLFGLKTANLITSLNVFLLIGLAGTTAGCFNYLILFQKHGPAAESSEIPLRVVAFENWSYGRWVLVAALASWLSLWAYFVLAGSMLSLEEVAGLKSIMNLSLPMTQVIAAFMLLFMPWASQRFSQHGMPALKSAVQKFSLLLAAAYLAYVGVVWLFKGTILDILYDGKFSRFEWMLPYFLLQPLLVVMTTSWLHGLRIIERTHNVMVYYVISGITTLTLGVLLISTWGLKGAVAGIVLSYLTPLPYLVRVWNKAEKQLIPAGEGEK